MSTEIPPFHAALRQRRRALGLRQDDVAVLAGVSERFVHALEAGKPTVRLDKLLSVAAVLGLHLELHPGSRDAIGVAIGVAPERSNPP